MRTGGAGIDRDERGADIGRVARGDVERSSESVARRECISGRIAASSKPNPFPFERARGVGARGRGAGGNGADRSRAGSVGGEERGERAVEALGEGGAARNVRAARTLRALAAATRLGAPRDGAVAE